MARRTYGTYASDVVTDTWGNVVDGASVTFWTARSGGTQVTDVLDYAGGALVGGVALTDSAGRFLVQVQDSVTSVWADAGGERFQMLADDFDESARAAWLPSGGNVGEYMVKAGVDDFDAGWQANADVTYQGAGSPEGVVTAPVGGMYRNTSGGPDTTIWAKESGTGNTGWKAVASAATLTAHVAAADPHPLYQIEYTGTGFPEGVVTAPVGSIYTDTAATNGAIRWIKATGTGNTGWEVEYGDTGWRNVIGDVLNGWTTFQGAAGEVLLRRTGTEVFLAWADHKATLATANLMYVPPSGFQVARYAAGAYSIDGSNALVGWRLTTSGMTSDNRSGTYNVLTASWVTDDSWPATLPGTAA